MITTRKKYSKPAFEQKYMGLELALLADSGPMSRDKNIPIYDDGLPDNTSAHARHNIFLEEDNEQDKAISP